MNNSKTPKWLKNTERNSWQIELLLSGGFIFVLFQIPSYVREHLFEVSSHSNFGTSTVLLFVGAVILSRVLLIGFLTNLLLRAIWLAFLGIHYAFPKGIDYERLDYSERFRQLNESKNTGLTRIFKMEKFCSISYSIAIMIAIVSVGILGIMFFIFLLIEQSEEIAKVLDNPRVGISLLFVLVLISFGILERIYFGYFKNQGKASETFFPVNKVISHINLSSIFKYEWYTLISNVRRWKIHGALFSYFLVALVITINDLDFSGDVFESVTIDFFDDRKYKNIPASSFHIQNTEYADLLKPGTNINVANIPSENISGNILPLFINYKFFFDESLEAKFLKDGLVATQEENNFNTTKEYDDNAVRLQKILNETFLIEVDEYKVPNSKWYFRNHAITDQKGFFTRVDISSLRYGEHEISIRFSGVNKEMEQDTFFIAWIPFWKE